MAKIISLAAFLVLFPLFAQAEVPLGTSLADLVRYAPKALPDASLLEQAKGSDPRFTAGGFKFRYDLHLDAAPAASAGDAVVYAVSALMADGRGEAVFRKFAVTVGGNPRSVQDVKRLGDIPLDAMHFGISVGLIDREVILDDPQHGEMLVFPLGVGGIDPALMGRDYAFTTPLYQGAAVDRANVQEHAPAPYRNLPVHFVTNPRGVNEGIAFHITILSDSEAAKNGLNYLKRGFESHGCMRLRYDDLMQFHAVLFEGAESRMPLNIDYFLWNKNASGQRDRRAGIAKDVHPYPLIDDSYERVIYFADRQPHYVIGPEGVVEMSLVSGQPAFSRLTGFTSDDAASLANFKALVDQLNQWR